MRVRELCLCEIVCDRDEGGEESSNVWTLLPITNYRLLLTLAHASVSARDGREWQETEVASVGKLVDTLLLTV